MKSFITFFILLIIFISFSLKAQIRNGSFEQWNSNEPAYWQTNNVNEPELIITPITQSRNAHSGSYSLKGEVKSIQFDGVKVGTLAPWMQSGDKTTAVFPFSAKPKQIRGYYNFQSVGGDKFIANFFLLQGENVIAVSGVTIDTSTGPGFHELILDLRYIDTVSTPTSIQAVFQIASPTNDGKAHEGSVFYLDDFPSLMLIKPPDATASTGNILPKISEDQETFVFISGEKDTIKWKGFGAEKVDIDYSLDAGKSFISIITNYNADSNKYLWKVPKDLLTREGKIRVQQSSDTSGRAKSINFTFKPWQLTRIDVNNKLELFEVPSDGWKFSNNRYNVWPESWWQQFDYSGIDPWTNRKYPKLNAAFFPFSFFPIEASIFPDWPLFVDVFGPENCYYHEDNGEFIYRSEATTFWAAIREQNNGSCFGFSISSLLYFSHKNSLAMNFPFLLNYGDLQDVPLEELSWYLVNYYMIHQFGRASTAYINVHKYEDDPRKLLQDLKDMFREINSTGKPLAFYNRNGPGAHSVTPYKLERASISSGFRLKVYDSRNPSDNNRYILIDSLLNTWTDLTGGEFGSGSYGCFLNRESTEFLSRPTMPNSINQNSIFKSTDGFHHLVIYNTSNADIIITSKNGDNIGFQDSVLFRNIPNGTPIVPMTSTYQSPIGYDLPIDTYSVNLNNFTDTSAYVFFLDGRTIYNYSRYGTDNDDTDELKFSENGLELINRDEHKKNIQIQSIILQDSTGEKVFTVNKIDLLSGSSVRIQEKDRHNLLLSYSGGITQYDLYARIASVDGEAISHYPSITLSENSSHLIVPKWENLENDQLKILIDLDNDGTINDSIYISNQITKVDNENNLGIPENYELLQNYPNPFNPTTEIRFSINEQVKVSLRIFDILGREVATLVNDMKAAGRYEYEFNGSNLPSGIYIAQMRAGSFNKSFKMMLLK